MPSPADQAHAEETAWMQGMLDNYMRNQFYARSGPYVTKLDPQQSVAFSSWVKQNKVPYNANDHVADYDMPGYWLDIASKGGSETGINPNDHKLHYPDTYKTPFHKSFSAESRYALPNAPVWANDHQLVDPRTKRVIYDEAVSNGQ